MTMGTMPAQPFGEWLATPRLALARVWAILAVRAASRGEGGKPKRRPHRLLGRAQNEEPKTGSAPPPRPAPDEGDLPESYGRNRVVLMVVSPYMVHAYWDLDRKTQANPAGSPACLRFHDTTAGQASSTFDVPVNLPARNWYVHLWGPAREYHVELGLTPPNGNFVALAHSNSVETPRAWPVAEVQEQFLRVGAAAAPVATEAAPQTSTATRPWPVAAPAAAALAPAVASALAAVTPPAPRQPAARSGAMPPPQLVWTAAAEQSHPSAAPVESVQDVNPLVAAAETALTGQPTGALSPRTALQPPPVTRPRLISAAEILRQRLTELYAFRWWRKQPAGTPLPLTADLKPPVRSDVSAGDLTALADSRFSPGLSSSLWGFAGSKEPAG